ncbi:MAG: hypothetical protein M3Q44_04115 [bacterium]|nr:hypothetical protein [bacterium]
MKIEHNSHLDLTNELHKRFQLRVVRPDEVERVTDWLILERPSSRGWTDYSRIQAQIKSEQSSALAVISEHPHSRRLNGAMLLSAIGTDLWYIPWIYIRQDERNRGLGRGIMYFGMLQGFFRGGETFQWDTSTEQKYNGSVRFHTRVGGTPPDLIKRGYFDNSPDNHGAIWIKNITEIKPRIIEFLVV